MSDTMLDPDAIACRLELNRAQLKVTHTALRSLLDDYGHDEHDVGAIVRQVLGMLPSDDQVRAIDLTEELKRAGAPERRASGDARP